MVELPTDFGISACIKIFLPGSILVGLFSLAIFPVIANNYWNESSTLDKISVWILISFISGFLLASIEGFIYRFFEGYSLLKINLLKNSELAKILADFEQYPYNQYGMDSKVFWPHFRLILSEESKFDLDLRSAYADLLVYTSFIFILYAPIAGVGFSFQLFGPVSELLNFNNIYLNKYIIYTILILIISLMSLVASYLFYHLSIQALILYSSYFKAVFDLFRFNLAKQFKLKVNLIPEEDEKDFWKEYGCYLKEFK